MLKSAAGETWTSYFYVAGQRAALRTHSSAGALLTYHLLADHLGSTTTALDANNNPTGAQQYYPYGATRTITGTLQTDHGFTGQRANTDIGPVDAGGYRIALHRRRRWNRQNS